MKLVRQLVEIYETPRYIEYLQNDALKSLEMCARVCYQSHNRTTDESAANFIRARIHGDGHLSILRQERIRAKFTCSRSVSHQLVRHVLANFLQESQRWCKYTHPNFGEHVTYIIPWWMEKDIEEGTYTNTWTMKPPGQCAFNIELGDRTQDFLSGLHSNEYYYFMQIRKHNAPAEDARDLLANDTKTQVVCNANLEEWLNIFRQRLENSHAQKPIRMLMNQLLPQFKAIIPVVFDEVQPFTDDLEAK